MIRGIIWNEYHKYREYYVGRLPIWVYYLGGGISGKTFIEYALKNKIRLPLAIIDSKKQAQGTAIGGVPVISLDEYKEKYGRLKIFLSVDANNRRNIRQSVSGLDIAQNLFDFKQNDLIMNYVWESHTEDMYHFMQKQ